MGGAVGLSGDADAHLGGGRHSSRLLGLEPACSQVLCRRTTWRVAAALLQYLEYFCPGAHRPVKQAPVIAPAVNKQAEVTRTSGRPPAPEVGPDKAEIASGRSMLYVVFCAELDSSHY